MVSTHLFPRAPLEDIISWGESSNGMFSTKLVYALIQKDSAGVSNFKWQAIWHLKVPKWVKVFMRQVLHSRIITNFLKNCFWPRRYETSYCPPMPRIGFSLCEKRNG